MFAASTGEIKGRRICTLRSDSNQLAHDTATTTTLQSLPPPQASFLGNSCPGRQGIPAVLSDKAVLINLYVSLYIPTAVPAQYADSLARSLSLPPIQSPTNHSYPLQKSTKCATTTAMCTLAATSSCASPTFASRRPGCSGHARPGRCGRASTSIKTAGRVEGRVEA